MSLIERKITVTLEYGTGPDGLGPPEEPSRIEGHRVSATVRIAGGASMGSADVRIYGLSLSLMNKFSTVGKLPLAIRRNILTIEAGDEQSGMSQIFKGTIQAAWADMLGAPEVAFQIQAFSGLVEAMTIIPGTSYPGGFDVAAAMQKLAGQMQLDFENNGVQVTLPKSYFPGAARDQAATIARDANINWVIENGTLAIWPKGGARGGTQPRLAADSGMVGYPTYTGTGIVATTLFNPNIRFGATVEVDTILLPAKGIWNVLTLVHDIEALVAGGKWFTQVQLTPPGYVFVA